jgi:hypothetical protein
VEIHSRVLETLKTRVKVKDSKRLKDLTRFEIRGLNIKTKITIKIKMGRSTTKQTVTKRLKNLERNLMNSSISSIKQNPKDNKDSKRPIRILTISLQISTNSGKISIEITIKTLKIRIRKKAHSEALRTILNSKKNLDSL